MATNTSNGDDFSAQIHHQPESNGRTRNLRPDKILENHKKIAQELQLEVVKRYSNIDLTKPVVELIPKTSCVMCWDDNDHSPMTICDGCQLGFHRSCYTNPLVKRGEDIFCSMCIKRAKLGEKTLGPSYFVKWKSLRLCLHISKLQENIAGLQKCQESKPSKKAEIQWISCIFLNFYLWQLSACNEL